MAKVIKSFSLNLETVRLLEDYCAASDNWNTTISRSKVVNDAIRWYITGDVAELVQNNEKLQKRFASVMIARDSPTPKRSWWRQIFGF